MALYVSFYEAAGRVNCARAIVSPCLSPSRLQHPDSPRGLWPREVPSSFYSRHSCAGELRHSVKRERGGQSLAAAIAVRVIDRGDEGRRRDGAHAGDGAQALHAGIVGGDAVDRLVRILAL